MFQVRTALARMKLQMEQESSKSQLASLEERINVAEQRWDHSKAGSMEEGELATSWGKSETKPEKARDLLQIFFCDTSHRADRRHEAEPQTAAPKQTDGEVPKELCTWWVRCPQCAHRLFRTCCHGIPI